MRPISRDVLNSLKSATRAALLNAGGARAVVRDGWVRVGETSLSFAGSMSDEHADRFVCLDTALDLDLAAGQPHHARALAEAQNYRLEPMDQPVQRLPVSHRGITRVERAFSGAILTMREALEDDGAIDADEARALLPALRALEDEIIAKRTKVEALAAGRTS